MKVFITGGTGFIGSEVIQELVAAGHEVVGLSRSEKSKQALAALGASSFDGSLEDLDSLKRGAQSVDAVIHCAFVHNFADFAAAGATDRQAIEAIGEALVGTNKPLLVTSGVPGGVSGHVVTEADGSGAFPRMSETAALPFAQREVCVTLVRPSRFVHGQALTNGFIAALLGIAAQKGVSAYVGDGNNHIHAVNVLDLAKLYLLALEKNSPATYQGVGDGAIPFRDVAEAIGKRLNVPTASISPEQAAEHFGFLGPIVGADNPASSEMTQAALGWRPTHPSLLEDLGK
ncbi:MAG: SDR family oxidoreductase [Propionibacteriaceae bacterium]|jgi:nucleoside-diphosphate-sugar epimerase|nr:SDR family oxidoreductase [Propionibacteriaceae bacterium]